MNAQEFRNSFDFSKQGSLGLEEEVWLVNGGGRLAPVSLEVLQAAGSLIGLNGNWLDDSMVINDYGESILKEIKRSLFLQPELPAQQIEITTDICCSPKDLIDDLKEKRKRIKGIVRALGFDVLFNPAPIISRDDLHVFPKKRYLDILASYGEKVLRGFIAGLHIHYGLKSHEQAVRAMNIVSNSMMQDFASAYSELRLSKYIALSGKDNFLSPKIESWDHYYQTMKNLGAIEDPTRCWWLVRLNPVGTIELRIADVTENLNKVEMIASKFYNLLQNSL